ncbi:MAG: type II toxin-antitoxin system Phd/YefM family antitoxin [bacterium]
MKDLQEILPVTRVKKELLEIIKRIERFDEAVAITRNGVPVSVMMCFDRYEGLMETIEILSDPATMKALKKSVQDFNEKRTVSHKEAWED